MEYCLVIQRKGIKWEGRVALMREMRNTDRVLMGKPEVKSPLGRARHRWENNSKYIYFLKK
jgi:hypothetical protein